MTKFHRKAEALKAYLKRMENPYLSLQVTDDAEDQTVIDATSAAIQPYVRHPYAFLSAPENENDTPLHKVAVARPVKKTSGTLSKAEFRHRCRRIFEQYIPAMEESRLRKHHQDFIARNESASPAARHLLFSELQKYDLSNEPGLRARFNRERDSLTEEKLKQIESLVHSESK